MPYNAALSKSASQKTIASTFGTQLLSVDSGFQCGRGYPEYKPVSKHRFASADDQSFFCLKLLLYEVKKNASLSQLADSRLI